MEKKERCLVRLKEAAKFLKLALKSGYLFDRRGRPFGDMNADARVFVALKLVEQAIDIQVKGRP